jgi:hypothetical protein
MSTRAWYVTLRASLHFYVNGIPAARRPVLWILCVSTCRLSSVVVGDVCGCTERRLLPPDG